MRAVLPIVVALSACAVTDVDFEGKACRGECPDELTCVDSVCRRITTAVWVDQLHPEWVTPNSIRWGWTMRGNGSELANYELIVTSERAGANGVRTWTASDLAELGGWQLKRSGSFDVVSGTITYDLDPSTTYAMKVVVHDAHGRSFTSNEARATTDDARSLHVPILMNGAVAPSAALQPNLLTMASGVGVEGGTALEFSGGSGSFENLMIWRLDLPFSPAFTDKTLGVAYLEFWIRGSGAPSSAWSGVQLWLGHTASCPSVEVCAWEYPGKWVYHPDASTPRYRRVQIPLHVFAHLVDPKTGPSVADTTNGIYGVSIGLPLSNPSDRVNLDRIGIYW